MLQTYCKIAWRNLSKSRFFAVINIGGLTVGLASFIVILIYFNYEMSYDRWDASLASVYKVGYRQQENILSTSPAPLASFLRDKDPKVMAATAIMPAGDYEVLLASGDKKIYQKGLVTADSSFFKVFPYKLVRGDAATAFDAPNAIILSEGCSHKLFGDQDPVGKTIKVYNAIDAVVTGVLAAPDGPSHLDAQLVMRDPSEKRNKFWQNYSYQTYVKLHQPADRAVLEKELDRLYAKDRLKKGDNAGLFVDAVADLHNFPQHGTSNFKITVILLVLAVFLLVAGAINFSNLSLARAFNRAREVGVRKVLGSGRGQIVFQALFEVTVQCLASLVLALLLVQFALPWFSSSFHVTLDFHHHIVTIAWQLAATLALVVLFSGLYPALFLSNFRTAEVLKGKYNRGAKGILFRNSLLLVQLTLSALFMTGIIVINRQMHFMQSRDLGFNASSVIRIEATQKTREEGFAHTRELLLSIPGVEAVSKSTAVPGAQYTDTGTNDFKFAGKTIRLNTVKVGIDYFRTMDIKLLQGRYFAFDRPEDMDHTAILNESAMRLTGSADPIGRQIYFPDCDTLPYTVVGVVKDFNVGGFENKVIPAVYSISNAHCGYQSGGAILAKINTARVSKVLAGISTTWKTVEPEFPVRFSFLDQNFASLLERYLRLEKIIFTFSIISILIAMTGLFALTSFLAQQRTKEIGIRKVLGASVANITGLLSRDFVRLLAVSMLIAIPVAYWALTKWLEDFAYRVRLDWWMFGLAAVVTIAITLLTVCWRAISVAMKNPVASLRSE